jgi:hypothetical protein
MSPPSCRSSWRQGNNPEQPRRRSWPARARGPVQHQPPTGHRRQGGRSRGRSAGPPPGGRRRGQETGGHGDDSTNTGRRARGRAPSRPRRPQNARTGRAGRRSRAGPGRAGGRSGWLPWWISLGRRRPGPGRCRTAEDGAAAAACRPGQPPLAPPTGGQLGIPASRKATTALPTVAGQVLGASGRPDFPPRLRSWA